MKNILLLGLTLLTINNLYGESNSLSSFSMESNPLIIQDTNFKEISHEEKGKEIKDLFKINISPLILFRPTIAYEVMLGKKFSSETSISYEKHASLFFVSDLFILEEYNFHYYPNGLSFRGYQMFKFYHNIEARKKLGKSTKDFEGNFFAVQLLAIYAKSGDARDYWGAPLKKESYYFSCVGLSYGLQRRILNFGYIEPSVFVDILAKSDFEHSPLFNLGLKLKMGFAIESLRFSSPK